MNNYDLIVVGGGTAGCAAAYIAGKLGLKTILIEKKIHLGGSISSGLVLPAMKSSANQINTEFFEDLIEELKLLGGQVTYQNNPGWFNPELIKIALDRMMAKAKVDVFFSSNVTALDIDNRMIKTVKINRELLSVCHYALQDCNKKLSVSICARYIVDATGNCEIGKISNCKFLEKLSEIQPFSLRFIMSGINMKKFSDWLLDYDKDRNVTTVEHIDGFIHLSTAYTWDKDKKWALAPLFDEAVAKGVLKDHDRNYFQIFSVAGMPCSIAFNCPRMVDTEGTIDIENISNSLILARETIFRLANFCKIYFPGFENAYISNIADDLGIRTSRRIKGKYIYTIDDITSGKTFDHPVVVANYPIDVHSKNKNSSTLQKVMQDYQIPVEALMSADIDNLFVAGRCISTDFMAQGAVRIQTSCFSMGESLSRYIFKEFTKKNRQI